MQKLYIARNKNGKYYTKIINNYTKCEKFVSVSLPKDVELNADYGSYNCEYFLSCYKTQNGNVEISIIVTKLWQDNYKIDNPDINPYSQYQNKDNDIPF